MKNVQPVLQTPKLRAAFSNHAAVPKSALRRFYRAQSQNFNEQSFRRILYALKKEQVLRSIGSGMYALEGQSVAVKAQFTPKPSRKLSSLRQLLLKTFPYLNFTCWDTGFLREFMVHQPGSQLTIVEAEKEACESVFNAINEKHVGKTFLDPDNDMMTRYVLPQTEPILVLPLVTQSPLLQKNGGAFPKLEKILVDVLENKDVFLAFQGEELVNIYQGAFAAYWINEKTLFRYAGRRNAERRILDFIQTKTTIQLDLRTGNQS